MYLHIKRIKFSIGEELLMFVTLSRNVDLFGAIRNAVAEHNKLAGREISGEDYIDVLLAVKKVPDDLCAKYGFRLLRDFNYSYIQARRGM